MDIYKKVWSGIWDREVKLRIIYIKSYIDIKKGECVVLQEVDDNDHLTGRELNRMVEEVYPDHGLIILEKNRDTVI